MNKILLSALSLLLVLNSCKKTDHECETVTITAPAAEVNNLRQYIMDHNITAAEDYRGFFYHITDAGSGASPTACSNVTVSYIGKLTNGTIFDQANNVSFGLSGLIPGWQEGVPLIAEGGKITLYLPPSLGYGNNASGSIPVNSITIFTIDLLYIN